MNKFPYFKQLDQMDCGPTCLRMVAKSYGRHYSAQTLRDKAKISRDGVSMLGLAEAAELIGLKATGVRITSDQLVNEIPLPCILHWDQNHFVVLYKVKKKSWLSQQFLNKIRGGKKPYFDVFSNPNNICPEEELDEINNVDHDISFHIADPAKGYLTYTLAEFEQHWAHKREKRGEGLALLLEPTVHFYEQAEEKTSSLKFGQLLSYLFIYKRLVIQLMIGMLVGSGFTLVLPLLTQSVVDVGIGTQNIDFIYIVLIAQMVLMLSSSAVEFLRSWILLHISTRLNLTILSEFLAKLTRLPLSFFDVKQFGDIMQRIGDHHRIESFLTGQTLSILFSLFNLIVFGAVLAYYNLTIFSVAAGASALYGVWAVMFLKSRRKLDMKRFHVSARNQSQTVQLIQGMQDIKLSGSETSKRWEWEGTQARLFKVNVKSLSLTQFQQAGALIINQSKNIFITFLAAKAVINGEMTLGEMMSVQYILGQFNAPIEQMINFLQSWQDAQISIERLNEVHMLPDEEASDINLRQEWGKDHDILIENVTYTYPGTGNQPVLKDINLHIPNGKTTAIVGTSGSGKTTLLKLLLRFYTPDSGKILISSNSVRGLSLDMISHRAWRKQCGVVMQEGFIFSESVARNIATSDESIDHERLIKAAQASNIHDFIESLPQGYHTKIGTEGNGISQGQKQRILIARAIYKNPWLILFDEATNALDANNEAVILSNLEEFFHGRTVIVVAHRLSTVKNAFQIIVMEKGEIKECGTHNELIARRGKYYELISNQLELGDG